MRVKNFLAYLIMIAGGVALGLIFLEFMLHLMPPATWKGLIGKNPVRYQLYQTDKAIGWRLIPNKRLNYQGTGEYNVDVQINSLGLRDRERTYAKPPNTFRILVLGDSFAEAAQVPLEHIFPVQLEQCLIERRGRSIEVVNAGVSSYGPGDELLFFINEGKKYQPDLVLTELYIGNDLGDLTRAVDDTMIQSLGGYQFYQQQGQLQKRWIEWAEPDYEISLLERFLRRYSILYYTLNAPDSRVRRAIDKELEPWWPVAPEVPKVEELPTFPAYAYNKDLIIFAQGFPNNPAIPPYMKETWQLFITVYRALQAEIAASGSRSAVVILPTDAQTHPAIYAALASKLQKRFKGMEQVEWDISAPNQAINNFLHQEGIPTLDLLPAFQAYAAAHNELLYFPDDQHFNEIGQKLAADLMCDWLIEQELVP